jgi:hypothetical protein
MFVVMAVLLLAFATPAVAGAEVPIKGTLMGEHGPPDFEDEDCIAAGYAWRFPSAGVGQMSHLGRVEYTLTQCTVPGPEGFESEGTVTLTAANGDKLFIEHTMLSQLIGEFDPDPDGFTLVGTWEAVGGTGRFAHATGSGTLDGVGDIRDGEAIFDIPDGLAQFNFKGKIAYDASDRSK